MEGDRIDYNPFHVIHGNQDPSMDRDRINCNHPAGQEA
jgi:hypothetical protein